MSLSRATALTRPVLRRCFTTTLVHKPPVNYTLKGRCRFLSTRAAEDDGGLGRKLQEVLCRFRGTVSYFNVWTILRKLGVPYCMIIQFRRRMKKIYYVSGLSTVMRAAFPIIVGDLLAQTVYPLLFDKKPKKEQKKKTRAQKVST
uniref:DNA-directed RNA polymerase subunit beta n=1 Tax=Lygus hesperus TaxID=30085 RepID=A0A0A9XX93_LYGHE